LIGASLGLAARAAGIRVMGWDAAPAHLAEAAERGALDATAASLDELVERCDSIAVALPLPATLALLRRFAARPPAARLVIDVASLKEPVRAAAGALATFVGTHPIAGSERSGPGAADGGLFRDRTWTYEADAAEPARAAAVALILATGARPLAIGSVEHDRLVALTSHLPQVVAVALASRLGEALGNPATAALCGPGARSMTRLGGSSWTMWEGILAQNGQSIAQEVRSLAHILSEAAEALQTGRSETLEPWFAAAALAVSRLNEP